MRGHHFPRSGIGEEPGRRIFAILPLPRRAARAERSERNRPQRAWTCSPAGWTASTCASIWLPDFPPCNVDPEQFKRVIVNLVDNAAEAMRDSLVKRLLVATRATSADTVELLVADTGCGISAGDKEKLFLPYFSTKGRGTGLGLAIVSHILSEHGARIRVEDNRPAGARFYVEVPA